MKCINCNKKLLLGEFVVLNGGSLLKTKTGAMMEDKNHIGFLTINNHFDSKPDYRSLIVTDKTPNGQFEFYACSHKCLAVFFSKQIMYMAERPKFKNIKLASQSKLNKIGYEWAQKVINLMGFKSALITDESTVSNFMYTFESDKFESGQSLKNINKKLGFELKPTDYIWQIAKKLKAKDLKCSSALNG